MKYFAPFRFDERAGRLTRAGQAAPLTRKAAQLLRCLLDRAGEVVTGNSVFSFGELITDDEAIEWG